MVLKNVMTACLPRKPVMPIRNPAGTPTTHAASVDQKLTFRDTPTIRNSSGSNPSSNWNAAHRLSRKNMHLPLE
jgi:hypothetical protein